MSKPQIPMPVLLHPRLSKIASKPFDFFERMNLYASSISKQIKKPEFKLTLLVGLPSADLPPNLTTTYPYLRVVRVSNPTLNVHSFAERSLAFLAEHQIQPNILIAGDTSFGLLACLRARSLSTQQIPVQISIHGTFHGQASSFISFAKLHFLIFILRYSLPYIQSIRVVSREVEQEMIHSFRIDTGKIFIAPIPFASYPKFHARDFQEFNIGVIGRMHPERNLGEILEILEDAISIDLISRVFFLGSGPLEKKVQKWKNRSAHWEKISLEGSKTHAEVLERLPDVDILLSAAETEGYGLAIREALVAGAIVVARKNEGTKVILESFQSGIHLYETVLEAQDIIRNLLSGGISLSQCKRGRKIQEAIDREALERIRESWASI